MRHRMRMPGATPVQEGLSGRAAQRLDHRVAQIGGFDAETAKHAPRHGVVAPQQPEGNVLDADVVVLQANRFAQRQLETPLGPWREGQVPEHRAAVLAARTPATAPPSPPPAGESYVERAGAEVRLDGLANLI